MAKAKKEESVDVSTAMDALTDEIVAELTVESKMESDAVETIVCGNYDGVPDTIPSELEVFVHALRLLAESNVLKSKINRLLDEIEQSFEFR